MKEQAEREGLDEIFKAAGFEWREPGCSMCLAMNADRLEPGERCASTSNRNFEGRQGAGGRTHLVSPAMAARPRCPAISSTCAAIRDGQNRAMKNLMLCCPAVPSLLAGCNTMAGAGRTCRRPASRSKTPRRRSKPMQTFTVHKGLVAPMDRENVDTDAIIPKQFLKSIKRTGFGPNLFDAWRYLDPGEPGQDPATRKPNPDFVLNQPR